jgi:hypothetical protein
MRVVFSRRGKKKKKAFIPFSFRACTKRGLMTTTTTAAFGCCMMVSFACCHAQNVAPVVIPSPPNPFFSWDTIPTAFHGANRTGVYSEDAVKLLARNSMVTIEKWYTPCASQGPVQSGPECYVEEKIETVLGRIKAVNPNVTGILCKCVSVRESVFVLWECGCATVGEMAVMWIPVHNTSEHAIAIPFTEVQVARKS